ncbi:MAG TPA: PAS domain S-box protein [Candidatus Hydrogenedentes bacterium]|nr:PAS domain S-box protein [Candidatus Hydrogenedentota bacterium]HPG67539.1 PAS domain S-box protein [Candidatus Hydrogenedentota bacterium]
MKLAQFITLTLAYTITLALLGVVSVVFAFPYLLFAMIVPVLFAAFLYPRRVYLVMFCLLIPVALAVTFETLPRSSDSVKATVSIALMVLATAEILQTSMLERKRAEEALRESEERYRSLIENLPVGLYRNTPGPEGHFIMVNTAAARLHGYDSVEEFLRTPVASLYASPAERERFSNRLMTVGKVEGEELHLRRKDGSLFWAAVTARVIRDRGGSIEYFDGVIEDITDRKLAEQTIAEQRAQMANASRLSSLGVMASGIAHEINNPLAVISVAAEEMAELVAQENPASEWHRRIVATIIRNVERIERIIRGLRSLSRDGATDPFSMKSLRTIVDDTLELCRVRFRTHGVELIAPAEGPDIEVECRGTQLSQVLMNLLNNAESAVENLEEKWVRVSINDRGDTVELSVTDSGKGLPPVLRERILEPFFTTKEVGKGTGLGLSISKSIIERHRGELFLDTDSVNTRFVVRFPKRQQERAQGGEPWVRR